MALEYLSELGSNNTNKDTFKAKESAPYSIRTYIIIHGCGVGYIKALALEYLSELGSNNTNKDTFKAKESAPYSIRTYIIIHGCGVGYIKA